jgi:hypothetical protein
MWVGELREFKKQANTLIRETRGLVQEARRVKRSSADGRAASPRA